MVDTVFWWVGCVICCASVLVVTLFALKVLQELAFRAVVKGLDSLLRWGFFKTFVSGGLEAVKARYRQKHGLPEPEHVCDRCKEVAS